MNPNLPPNLQWLDRLLDDAGQEPDPSLAAKGKAEEEHFDSLPDVEPIAIPNDDDHAQSLTADV